jgi:hypothetical protein
MNSQKREMHEALRENKFNPSDFETAACSTDSLGGLDGEAIRLKGTTYFFAVYSDPRTRNTFYVEYSPGGEMMEERDSFDGWNSTAYFFSQHYLYHLERELKILDPWAEAKAFSDKVLSSGEGGDTKQQMTGVEREAIWKALGAIQETLLIHVSEDERKATFTREQFRILREAGEHMGRKDYLMLIYGSIAGLCATLAVPPETMQKVAGQLHGLINVFQHLL